MINELLLIIIVFLHASMLGWIVYQILKFKARILQFKDALLSIILHAEMEVDELIDKLVSEEAAAFNAGFGGSPQSGSVATSDAEVTKKRERLAAVCAAGQSQRYLGRALSLDQVDKLPDSEIIKLYARYEMLLGASITKTIGHDVLTIYSDFAAYYRPQINPISLTTDLKNDPLVEIGMSAYSGSLYHRFGMLLTPIKVVLTTIKHCKFGEDNGGDTASGDSCEDAPTEEP